MVNFRIHLLKKYQEHKVLINHNQSYEFTMS